MSEWKEYKLGEIIVTNAKSINKDYPYQNIKYLDTGSITCNKIELLQDLNLADAPSRAKRLVNDDDIIYSTVRPDQLHYGYITSAAQNLVVSTGFVTITCDKEIVNPKFLYYNLTQNQTTEFLHSIAEASTSTYPSLKPSDLEALDIILPPLSEQERIASILSSLDDKIDLLNRQNQTLESMAEALFRHYFIDNPKEEWKDRALGDFITETIGGEWGKDNCEKEFSKAVQCIRGTDIADLNVGLANKTPIRYIKESKLENIEPNDGDLILEISGGTETQSTGRVTYINEDVKVLFDYPLVFSNFCRMLRIKNQKYSYFVYLYIQYLYKQDEFFNLENGSSGIKNLDYKAVLFNMKYRMPISDDSLFAFNKTVELYYKKINTNKLQILSLIKLRDSLLPRLVNKLINI